MKRVLLAALSVSLLAGALFAVPTVWLKPWRIEDFYTRVFARYLLEEPMLLSALRVIEPWGLRFHEDDLGDFSVAFKERRAAWLRWELETLRSYDRDSQSPAQRLSSEVLDWFLDDQVRGEPFLLHDYPLNSFDGVHSSLPEFMIEIHPLEDATGARNYVARLERFGPALDQVIDGVRRRRELGVVPPRFVVRKVREDVAGLLEGPAAELDLYTHFDRRLAGIAELSEPERARLLGEALRALEETVRPAYRRIDALLAELEGVADDRAGVWKLPDGAAYYAWVLRHHTTTEWTPAEVHALGVAEVERLSGEIRAILAAEGPSSEDLGATLAALHADPSFLYPDSDTGREAVLAEFRRIVDAARPRLPALFGLLPRAAVEVERVPSFKEAGSARAYYFPPAMDGSRPGVFYANLREVDEHPRFGMHTLAYHEAIPGHHLQIAIAFEREDVPFFRRIVPFTAYVEGWALYAERLAAEQGWFPAPLDRVGQLAAELFRAVRLVVDTGLHAERWSRERAIDYMRAVTGMAESEVVAEVERYVVLPGQACAYKAGQLRLLALRERARAQLGERFDLRAFHDLVLGSGAVPLTVLERIVDEWAEAPREVR